MCRVFTGFILAVLAASKVFVEAERIVCSFTSGSVYRRDEYAFQMTDIPVSLCTHVVYDRLAIDLYSKDTPYFTLTNPDADEPFDEFEKFSALKRTNPQLKLIICLRSIFIAQVASEPDQRRALIERLVQFMSTYNLDGVELFWADERFKSEESLYLLLEEVKSGFRAANYPTWEVTILIDIDHQGLDHARLCRQLDFVHIVGASERIPKYHNKNTKPSANALINIDGKTNFTLDGALQHWIDKGCPAQKIVLGVTFIAQVFKLEKPFFRPNFYVKDLRTFCTLTEDRPSCSYIELCPSFNKGDWTMGWDDTAGLAPMFAGVVLIVLAVFNVFVEAERVVCSFSSSAADRTGEYAFEITDIPISLCTHIVYDSLQLAIDVHSNDTPNILLVNPDVAVGGWRKFAALKSIKPELKLLISIRNPLIAQAASESDQRKALIEVLIEYMADYKLDGVELFWGGYGIQSEHSLYLLVEELKSSFRAAGHPTWEVTILVEIDHEGIDHARLGRLLDFVHVVGAGERKPKYGNNSTMPSANALFDVDDQTNMTLNDALQYWIDKGCPADKIVLGVVFIAQVFQLKKPNTVKTPMTYCTVPEEGPFCAYIEMCQKFNESDWTMGWDDTEGMAPHAFQTDYWAAYENEASVGRKGEIAREKGLAGVYAVALDLDDYRGKCGPAYPLLKSLCGSYRQKANN